MNFKSQSKSPNCTFPKYNLVCILTNQSTKTFTCIRFLACVSFNTRPSSEDHLSCLQRKRRTVVYHLRHAGCGVIVDKYSVLLVFIYMMSYLTNFAEFLFELLWLLNMERIASLNAKTILASDYRTIMASFNPKKGAIESLIHRHCSVVTMLSFVFSQTLPNAPKSAFADPCPIWRKYAFFQLQALLIE